MPTSTLLRLALLVLAVTALPAAARGQGFLYALSEKGKLTVNGTLFDSLSSKYDPEDVEDQNAEQRWVEVVVRGSDRYALRADGRVSLNGVNLYKLNDDPATWVDLTVTDNGDVWAVRQGGRVSLNGENAADITANNHTLTATTTDGTDVYHLRTDGAVYRNTVETKLFAFEAGNFDGEGEGDHPGTTWVDIQVDPLDGMVYALRRDGSIVRGDPSARGGGGDPDTGVIVAKLPIGDNITSSSQYQALSFGPDGRWWVVRGSGRVFNEDDLINDVIDLPGDPDNDTDALYTDIVATADDFVAVRRDGHLYDIAGVSIVNLTGDRYGFLAVSLDAPDLTNFKNAKPKVARFQVKAITGDDLVLPILATDTDKATEDLIVTVDPESLPEGVVYDAEARTFTWTGVGPAGKYSIPFEVDDGIAKPVKVKFSIKVSDPDTSDTKNRPPRPTKIKKTQALSSFELVLPIFVVDPDGDMLTVTVDETQPPFTLGAVFDPEALTITWTPAAEDVGKYTLKFQATDGTKTKGFKVKMTVANSILAL